MIRRLGVLCCLVGLAGWSGAADWSSIAVLVHAQVPDRTAFVVGADIDSDSVNVAVIESRFDGATEMRVGNTRAEVALSTWVPYVTKRVWYLPGFNYRTIQHVVYAEFRGPALPIIQMQLPVYREYAERRTMAPTFPVIHVPDDRSSDFIIRHHFDEWNERWVTYQDTWGSGNVFMPMSHETAGGVNRGGYIWTDASRWIADSPETPDSILVAMNYWRWMTAPAWASARGYGGLVNLSNGTLRVSLRGHKLRLGPAAVTFWVVCDGARWHLRKPFAVADGRWVSSEAPLSTDTAAWERSWARAGASPPFCLDKVESYGFAFRGIVRDGGVSGVLDMDEFSIRRGADAPEPRGPSAAITR